MTDRVVLLLEQASAATKAQIAAQELRDAGRIPWLADDPGRRLIFAELKTERGRVRPEQQACMDALAATGAEVYVWRPQDWLSGNVERLLRDEQKKAA